MYLKHVADSTQYGFEIFGRKPVTEIFFSLHFISD